MFEMIEELDSLSRDIVNRIMIVQWLYKRNKNKSLSIV
jgi:hypothetical protein